MQINRRKNTKNTKTQKHKNTKKASGRMLFIGIGGTRWGGIKRSETERYTAGERGGAV